MSRDSMMFLVNIQLAIMGVVLVAGLFYLWRMICRVEQKVDNFLADMDARREQSPQVAVGGGFANELDETDADDFMNEVFGAASPLIITQQPSFQKPIVEIEEEEAAPVCNMSDAGTTISQSCTSKSKLKRMSAESLREVCKEKGLSADGTKAVLLDRILETMDDHDE